jgi:chemotaxis protein MotB
VADANKRPIIVIKKKGGHGGHHGGAWKVAYADFVTAMMSLFIVLWLLNSTPQVKKSVAGYFNDPKGSGSSSGSTAAGTNESVSITKTNVEKLKEEIEKAILNQPDLKKLNKQVEMTIMGEGLKIELIEDKGGTFFESGSAKLSPDGVNLMDMLAGQLKVLPNAISIEGHTDAQPYASDNGYTNWELSTDRANSARRILHQQGVGEKQISEVRGYADQQLRVPSNPLDPSNRRISLIVGWVMAPESPVKPGKEGEGKEGAAKEGAAKEGEAKEGKTAEADSKTRPESTEGKPAGGDVPRNPAKDKPSGAVTADGKPMPATPTAAQPADAKPAVPVKLSIMDRIKAMMPGKKAKPTDTKPTEGASKSAEGEAKPDAETKPAAEGAAPAEGSKPAVSTDGKPAPASPAAVPAKTGMAGIMDKLKAMMPGKKK